MMPAVMAFGMAAQGAQELNEMEAAWRKGLKVI